jgi:hypothetical protein
MVVVAIIEAYQQALSGAPSASARLPHLDGMWNFVPLGLLIVGGVFWVIGRLVKPHSIPVAQSIVAPHPSPDADRVITNLSPAQLCRLYKEHTTYDANKLAESYISTWLSISGGIYNVDIHNNGESRVCVEGVDGPSLVICSFGKQWQKQASIYKKGNSVKVNGKIGRIEASVISLHECEFV